MNQQPDKFFREKLEGYQKAAPSSVWEKIAAAQAKKNNNGLWLKIAASLLFLVVSAYLLWTKITPDHKQTPTLTTVEEKNTPAEVKNEKQSGGKTDGNQIVPQPTVVEKQKLSSINKTTVPKLTHKDVKTAMIPKSTNQKEVSEEVYPVDETTKQKDVVLPLPESMETSVATQSSPVHEEQQNITLVFTAKEADEYLDKKALAQATSDEKKPSTLKKLLKKANDLSSQDPFGELRQKKNEILALNFKNEKRGQNK